MMLLLILLVAFSPNHNTQNCEQISDLIQKNISANDQGRHQEGLSYIKEAAKKMDFCPQEIQLRVWHQLSVSYLFTEQKDSVIYYAKKVLNNTNKDQGAAIRIQSLTNLAMLSNQAKSYQDALYYNKQVFKHYQKEYLKNPTEKSAFKKSLAASNLALTLNNLAQKDSSSFYSKISLELHPDFNNDNFKSYNFKLAADLIEKTNPTQAKAYVLEAIKLAVKTKNKKQQLQGRLKLLSLGNEQEKLESISFIEQQNLETLYPGLQMEVLSALQKYYSTEGDYKTAYNYFQSLIQLQAQQKIEKAGDSLAVLTQKYKEVQAKSEQLQVRLDIKQKNIQLLTLGLVLIVLCALIAYLILKNTHRKKLLDSYFSNQEEFQRLLELIQSKDGSQGNTENVIYNKLMAKLKQNRYHLDPNINLGELAVAVGTNTKYLSQAVNEVTQNNISHLINTLRIAEAKILIEIDIRNNELKNLNEYWSYCGFNSNVSFYRAFKKITGISPADYKKEVVIQLKKAQ